MDQTRKLVLVFIAIFIVEHAAMLLPAAKSVAFPTYRDRAEEGRRVAARLGCFSCHGPEGTGGIPNPGSDDGVVPALAGGEIRFWASNEEQLKMWILDGMPASEPSDDARAKLTAGQGGKRAIVMPAFRDHLLPGELDALVAYVVSISALQTPKDAHVAKGLTRMKELGCFRCHGSMGIGGVSNPKSLKGYVPGFGGEDFPELVTSREELHEWIRDGVSTRFAANPLASAVLHRQALKMPAYGRFLNEEEIGNVVAAVAWLAAGDWRSRSFE